jgi:hypothetical protein
LQTDRPGGGLDLSACGRNAAFYAEAPTDIGEIEPIMSGSAGVDLAPIWDRWQRAPK